MTTPETWRVSSMCLGQGKLLTLDFLLSLWAETFQDPPLLSGSTSSISQARDQLGLERNRWENWPLSIPLESALKCTFLSLHIRIIGDAQAIRLCKSKQTVGFQPSSLWRVKNLKEFHQSSAYWVHIALVCPASPSSLSPSFPFWGLASYPLWIFPKYFCASLKIIIEDFINHRVEVHGNGQSSLKPSDNSPWPGTCGCTKFGEERKAHFDAVLFLS